MTYVSQITMLYTLNLYSAICQLYLNKTGSKKGFYFLFIFCIVFLSIIKSKVLKSSLIVEFSNFLFHLSQFLLYVFWGSVVGVYVYSLYMILVE